MERLDWPFRGTEALAAGIVTPHRLRTEFAKIHRDVYVRRGQMLTPVTRAVAAWLWSGRAATVAGLSAAALHRTAWIDHWLPAELNRRSRDKTAGIILHSDTLWDDETCVRDGIRMTTPARTAFDLGRRKGLINAVIRLDALANATELKVADVEVLADRHRGARGLVQLRRMLPMVDGGAESPYETRTRLALVAGGLPRPRTQIEPERVGCGVSPHRYGLGGMAGRCGIRRRPPLDRCGTTDAGYRSTGRPRGPRLEDRPRQRRLAARSAWCRRRTHPPRIARRWLPDLTGVERRVVGSQMPFSARELDVRRWRRERLCAVTGGHPFGRERRPGRVAIAEGPAAQRFSAVRR